VEREPRYRLGDPEPSDAALSDESGGHPRQPDLGEPPRADRVELNRRIAAGGSVLVYGEQGAMLACSQMVNIVRAPTRSSGPQVMDEARHNGF
jgi:hypothetical protein